MSKDGGPAFPTYCSGGMTLRDWFAGQALMGLIASNAHALTFNPDDDGAYVYAIADAMLKAREGTS